MFLPTVRSCHVLFASKGNLLYSTLIRNKKHIGLCCSSLEASAWITLAYFASKHRMSHSSLGKKNGISNPKLSTLFGVSIILGGRTGFLTCDCTTPHLLIKGRWNPNGCFGFWICKSNFPLIGVFHCPAGP